jgi:hypothetical protein
LVEQQELKKIVCYWSLSLKEEEGWENLPFFFYRSKAKSTENACLSVKGKLCSFGLTVVVATGVPKAVATTTTSLRLLIKQLEFV